MGLRPKPVGVKVDFIYHPNCALSRYSVNYCFFFPFIKSKNMQQGTQDGSAEIYGIKNYISGGYYKEYCEVMQR